MSFIDWNAAAIPSQVQGQQLQNAGTQLEQVQKLRALNALRGVDLGNPNSVGSALNGLTSLGMVDQAKALTDLAQTRAINSASLPVVQSALSEAQSSMQPEGQQSDLDAQHRQILQQGADAVNDLLNTADPTQRATKAAAYKQKFAQMGLPQANIDEVLGDLSDQGLKQHEAFLTAAANGQEADHPTGYAASQNVFNANNPGGSEAAQTLQGHLANPIVQAALAKAGIDVSPGINQAISITGPARAAAASAPYTATEVKGPNNEPVTMSAANFAAGQAQPGARPIIGASPGQVQAQTSAAQAPYQAVNLPPGPGGQPRMESAAEFAQGRGAPTQQGQIQGPITAQPIEGPTIAQGAGLAGGAEASINAATSFENYSNGYKTRKANLDNLRLAARDISTGPNAPFWGHIGALAAEYGIKTPLTPTTDQTAAYEEVQKMAQSVLAQQKDTLGLPNTNQSVNLATGATPHENTSPLGLQRLAGVLEGNEDYINATRQAWDTWKQSGHGYETFQEFVPQFMRMFDPRVFQAQYLDPSAATKVERNIPNYAAQVKVAKRLGYIAGQ